MSKKPQNQQNKICPHLGLRDDPSTFLNYPSSWNVCHHVKPVLPPNLSHQQAVCLSASYDDCRVFKAPAGKKMPKALRDPEIAQQQFKRRFSIIMVLIGIITTVVLGIFFYQDVLSGLTQVLSPIFQRPEPISSIELPSTITPTLTPTTEMQPTLTPTQVPATPTLTPTVEPPELALDTPIGGDVQYVIHRVIEGEALGQYAARYNTTEEAIRDSNLNMPPVLQINQIIVIPIDLQDVENLPAFEVYQVEEALVSVQTLAEQLSVSIDSLLFYNDLQEGHELESGDWLLVPRERPNP